MTVKRLSSRESARGENQIIYDKKNQSFQFIRVNQLFSSILFRFPFFCFVFLVPFGFILTDRQVHHVRFTITIANDQRL